MSQSPLRSALAKSSARGLLIAALLAGGLSIAFAGESRSGEPSAVLLELFTSQGCSSCPPADRLLSRLAESDGVIALAFHVDYWNYIGWTDPFSAAAWSDRQRDYRRSFALPSIYTPQLVVDGRLEGVGADAREVDRLLARARKSAKPLAVSLRRGESAAGAEVEIEVRSVGPSVDSERAVLMLAVTESGLVTEVPRGENRGRSLANDNVVRSLEQVAAIDPSSGAPQLFRQPVSLPRSGSTRLVAFVQDSETLAVLGAGVLAGSALR